MVTDRIDMPRGFWTASRPVTQSEADEAKSQLPEPTMDKITYRTVHGSDDATFKEGIDWVWNQVSTKVRIDREKGYWTALDDIEDGLMREEADAQLPEHGGSFSGTSHITEHRFLGRTIAVVWTWTFVRPLEEKKFYDFIVVSGEPANPENQKVLMDGMELKGVTKVEVAISVNDANKVTITFIANSINKEES